MGTYDSREIAYSTIYSRLKRKGVGRYAELARGTGDGGMFIFSLAAIPKQEKEGVSHCFKSVPGGVGAFTPI